MSMIKLENMKVNVDLAAEIPEEFKSSKWYETIKNRNKISTNLKNLKR